MPTKKTKSPAKKGGAKKPTVKEPTAEEKTQAVEIVKTVTQHEGEVAQLKDLNLDRGKIELLKRTIAKDATDDELLMFINVCRGLGLSPFLRHVHLVKRWDSDAGIKVATVQVGIDGFRSIAEATGAYAGNDDPVFSGTKTLKHNKVDITVPESALATVRKVVQGVAYDFTATARWDEFYPGDKIGFMWRVKPHLMLGKCAEAQALRKAFPKVLGGVYVPEELDKTGTLKSPEEIADSKFEKAKKMIEGITDVKVLEDYLKKMEKSDTYSEEQKAKLTAIVNDQIKKLEKDDA